MSDEPGLHSIPDWVQKGILAIIAALTSVIAYFYRQIEVNNRTTIDDLKKQGEINNSRITALEQERLSLYESRGRLLEEVENLKDEVNELKRKV